MAYAEWLTKMTGKDYRLPTEAEWEYVARAGSKYRNYWWGEEVKPNMTNCRECKSNWEGKEDEKRTAPVGSFPKNSWGLHHTAGNVWEWTCSRYKDPYDGSEESCINKNDVNKSAPRSIRGGSWSDEPSAVRVADRGWPGGVNPDNQGDSLGFRLARSN